MISRSRHSNALTEQTSIPLTFHSDLSSHPQPLFNVFASALNFVTFVFDVFKQRIGALLKLAQLYAFFCKQAS